MLRVLSSLILNKLGLPLTLEKHLTQTANLAPDTDAAAAAAGFMRVGVFNSISLC